MKLKTFTLALLLAATSAFAQKVKYSKEEIKKMEQYLFNEGFNIPSPRKTSTVILKDGSTHKGFCNKIDTKKGQIFEVSLKDSITKKPELYNADQIAEMYVYPGNAEKIAKVARYMGNIRNYGTKKLTKRTNNDRIYFVNQTVSLKNKKDDKEFLMQVINPEFDDIISVYHDPRAKETGGISVGGSPQLGGGVIKSYYVKKGDKVMWLHKDDFEDQYDFLFGDNAEFMKKYPKNSVEWDYFSFLVHEYTEMSHG
ncbi:MULTISPECIES: hypothetical protein [Chryseobacterium]|uniref:Uncharacterized protein n=1 Tax=Chryseobacterium camelliae TaxID=1265445 RepID=A0ABU0TDD5_9FLAO|nr:MULTISPECIES: hypothetical protein [Chryseobacterium]MDT3407350.1 hypothetical protein [Pseudacidovorax intermedius]MDQ1094861.1 hypothetical protein [Chryseobacterium camelliae]MDQ1098801.1 hypothetical protein [Chryseobacterium sp. SORGH_AS_1048]MDR6086152.1 hypothetical protein [Chryseobacterium sp. SORGH_AS_0909]MDR6130522.1 hypothetical protein [Chryseobacterium sp. SORGH_AS_1175]